MAYKIKDITPKPSHPVEAGDILSSKERFLLWVEDNRSLVWGGIFLVVVVIVAAFTLNWLSQKKYEEGWALQGQAQNVYLDRPLDDVKKGKENLQKAMTLFNDMQQSYSGSKGADISLFLLGNSLMEEQNYAAAIEKYQEIITANSQDPLFTGLIQQRLGLAYLLNGDRESALASWQAVLDHPQTLNKDQIIFELAKLAESEEKTQEAVGHYKTLMQDYPLSPFSNEAAMRIKILAPEEQPDTSKAGSTGANDTKSESTETSGDSQKDNPNLESAKP